MAAVSMAEEIAAVKTEIAQAKQELANAVNPDERAGINQKLGGLYQLLASYQTGSDADKDLPEGKLKAKYKAGALWVPLGLMLLLQAVLTFFIYVPEWHVVFSATKDINARLGAVVTVLTLLAFLVAEGYNKGPISEIFYHAGQRWSWLHRKPSPTSTAHSASAASNPGRSLHAQSSPPASISVPVGQPSQVHLAQPPPQASVAGSPGSSLHARSLRTTSWASAHSVQNDE